MENQRLDSLAKELNEHFARQNEGLRELQGEVEDLTQRMPSALYRWGLTLPGSRPFGRRTAAGFPQHPTPSTGLKAQIEDFKTEVSDQHYDRQWRLIMLCPILYLIAVIVIKAVS